MRRLGRLVLNLRPVLGALYRHLPRDIICAGAAAKPARTKLPAANLIPPFCVNFYILYAVLGKMRPKFVQFKENNIKME